MVVMEPGKIGIPQDSDPDELSAEQIRAIDSFIARFYASGRETNRVFPQWIPPTLHRINECLSVIHQHQPLSPMDANEVIFIKGYRTAKI